MPRMSINLFPAPGSCSDGIDLRPHYFAPSSPTCTLRDKPVNTTTCSRIPQLVLKCFQRRFVGHVHELKQRTRREWLTIVEPSTCRRPRIMWRIEEYVLLFRSVFPSSASWLCATQHHKVDKLEFVQHVLRVSSEEGRNAELALYRKCPDEAEAILLQASPPLVYRAIKLNVSVGRSSARSTLSSEEGHSPGRERTLPTL